MAAGFPDLDELEEDKTRKDNKQFKFYKATSFTEAKTDELWVWYRAMTLAEWSSLCTDNKMGFKDDKAYGGIATDFKYCADNYISNKGTNDCVVEFMCKVDIDAVFDGLMGWKQKVESDVLSWGLGPTGNTPTAKEITKLLGKSGQIIHKQLLKDKEIGPVVEKYLALPVNVDVNKLKKVDKDKVLGEQKEKANNLGCYLFNYWLENGLIEARLVFYRQSKGKK